MLRHSHEIFGLVHDDIYIHWLFHLVRIYKFLLPLASLILDSITSSFIKLSFI
jgi:hypothetical protein